jgi:hypothetical protein
VFLVSGEFTNSYSEEAASVGIEEAKVLGGRQGNCLEQNKLASALVKFENGAVTAAISCSNEKSSGIATIKSDVKSEYGE